MITKHHHRYQYIHREIHRIQILRNSTCPINQQQKKTALFFIFDFIENEYVLTTKSFAQKKKKTCDRNNAREMITKLINKKQLAQKDTTINIYITLQSYTQAA